MTIAALVAKKSLKKGAKGSGVKLIQQALRNAGAELVVDSHFGDITDLAVRRFQIAYHLTADGEVGPLTAAALDKIKAKPVVPEPNVKPAPSVLKAAPWLSDIRACTGIKEFPGGANNPAIMKWREDIAIPFPEMRNYAYTYTGDVIPWCGFGEAGSMARCGIRPPFGAAATNKFLWADSWSRWQGATKLSTPIVGCIMTFTRSGGGHVATLEKLVGRTAYIRGYNQSDMVNVAPKSMDQFTAALWPPGYPIPKKELVGVITNAAKPGSEQ